MGVPRQAPETAYAPGSTKTASPRRGTTPPMSSGYLADSPQTTPSPASRPALNGGLDFSKEKGTRAGGFRHKVMYLRSSGVRPLVRVWPLASIVGYEHGEVRYSVGLTPHTLVKAREKAEV